MAEIPEELKREQDEVRAYLRDTISERSASELAYLTPILAADGFLQLPRLAAFQELRDNTALWVRDPKAKYPADPDAEQKDDAASNLLLILFISHRWETPEHPDPENVHLSAVKTLIQNAKILFKGFAHKGSREDAVKQLPKLGFHGVLHAGHVAAILYIELLNSTFGATAEEMKKEGVAADKIDPAQVKERANEKLSHMTEEEVDAIISSRLGVWYDYSCLPQRIHGKDRSEEDTELFRNGLSQIAVLSRNSLMVSLRTGDDDYEKRGWCVGEIVSYNKRQPAVLRTDLMDQPLGTSTDVKNLPDNPIFAPKTKHIPFGDLEESEANPEKPIPDYHVRNIEGQKTLRNAIKLWEEQKLPESHSDLITEVLVPFAFGWDTLQEPKNAISECNESYTVPPYLHYEDMTCGTAVGIRHIIRSRLEDDGRMRYGTDQDIGEICELAMEQSRVVVTSAADKRFVALYIAMGIEFHEQWKQLYALCLRRFQQKKTLKLRDMQSGYQMSPYGRLFVMLVVFDDGFEFPFVGRA